MIVCHTVTQYPVNGERVSDGSFEQRTAELERESCKRRVDDNIVLLKRIFNNVDDKNPMANVKIENQKK